MTTEPLADFSGLQPVSVWAHFATLCRIPRPSKREVLLRDELRQWAEARGLSTAVDAAGNLIVRKPASPGREHVPGTILQAHLDMVCQKNSDTAHDFTRDPIRPILRDGWLVAEGTTLGADNGIGVALMLAVLENSQLVHGPLEALFTVDEEAGMGGARWLAGDVLHGRLMLNLDTEDWGEFYLGCAGGLDVNVARNGAAEPVPAGFQIFEIALRGLRGGHSGVDIHEERGNAIKLLVRSLRDSGSTALADEIVSLFELSGTTVEKSGYYPGWTPNPASPLLALCQSVYRREFGSESKVQVIHAGLECGIIGAKYPGLDIVSFGPTIRGAHAPGEAVEIASVGHAWQLLTAILAAITGPV